MKHTIEEIEKMLETFKTKGGSKIHLTFQDWNLTDLISDLVEEVKWQRELVWNQSKHITNLSEENSRLRGALDYKNPSSYYWDDHANMPVLDDRGEIARKAVEGI